MTKIILLLLISLGAFSQTVFQGKILDKNTNEPVIGASIRSVDSPQNGTISNEDGEFIIKLNDVNKKLIVSHLTYNKVEIIVSESSEKIIYLEPAAFTLAEAVVGNPALNLVNLIIKKATQTKDEVHLSKAFYQKTSMFNGDYTKIHEMFFEMKWTTEGIQLWKPTKTRFAQIDRQRYTHQNFIYSCFLQSAIRGKYRQHPLAENPVERYDFKIEKYINEGTENELAVIKCTPKKKFNEFTHFTGRLFIDTQNEILLKIEGSYKIQSNAKWRHLQNVDVTFEKIKDKSRLKYIHIDHISKSRFLTKRNVEKAWIYCLADIENFSLGKEYKINEPNDDLIFFENSEYVKDFWSKEVPIFHTSLEKQIISNFEKKGLFKGNL